jgi:hypothetical protein
MKLMKTVKIHGITFEWSESTFHQETYRVFLSHHPKTSRWTLSAPENPSGEPLSSKTGNGEEDPKEVAIELQRESYERGALTVDQITDEGPFEISMEDFVPPKTRMVDTNQPIDPPRRICRYCRHLVWPQGVAAARARIFECALGNWTDQERGISAKNPSGPNLKFTCHEFKPEWKKTEETYY